MSFPLTRDDVITRLRDYPRENFVFIGSVFKGIALTVAGLVLLQILTNLRLEWIRLTPWIASMVAVFVTHITWNRGIILTNARSNILDMVFPMAVGVAEFFLFAILLQDKDHPTLWLNWLLCSGIHTAFGGAVASNRLHVTIAERDFDKEIRALGLRYLHWIRQDRFEALAIVGLELIAWALIRFAVLRRGHEHRAGIIQFAICVVLTAGLISVIVRSNQEREEIDEYVSSPLTNE